MQSLSKTAVALAALALATVASAQVTLYERNDFEGQSFVTSRPVTNLQRFGYNDQASSVVVGGNGRERWEVCEDAGYGGRCVVLRAGSYSSLGAMGLNNRVSSVRRVSSNRAVDDSRYAPVPTPQQPGQITFYENENFSGRSFSADAAVDNFVVNGFNDRASSAVVRGARWEACANINYGGGCVVLRPGQYASLAAMGMNDRISSVRAVGFDQVVQSGRYSPLPVVATDYGQRSGELLYQAPITSVRAVVDTPGQRCWVETEQVTQAPAPSNNNNVPGAILGAVIGGILGHQVGGGTGKDIATGVGVVSGGLLGNRVGGNVNNTGQQVVTTQNVQRCTNVSTPQRPTYWDVTYNFRGQEFRVQMANQPGNTVTVNEQGVPRG
jgi:uncharacterized protein YcfJ